jgi:hypothetical protein
MEGIMAYFEASAFDGSNIDEAFLHLIKHIVSEQV